MKTIILSILLLGAILCTAFFLDPSNGTTELIVIVDDTEADSLLSISSAGILHAVHVEGITWDEVIVYVMALTEVDVTPVYTMTLPKRYKFLSSLVEREQEVAAFTKEVAAAVAKVRHSKHGRQHSNIYGPLARQLNKLASSTSMHRYCFIYSDVSQNNNLFNAYDHASLKKMENNPAAFRKKFEEEGVLQNLTGIDIRIIFNADEATNERFRIMSTFLKEWFTERGAAVFIEATLN